MITKITKRSQFPKYIREFKEVKGLHIGGCIDPEWHLKGAGAHAHVAGEYKGWICFKYKYYFRKLILLHEVAHLIVGERPAPHGKTWRKAVTRIGGTFKSFSYSAKKKNARRYFPNYSYVKGK